jgi:hypothetical protein
VASLTTRAEQVLGLLPLLLLLLPLLLLEMLVAVRMLEVKPPLSLKRTMAKAGQERGQ